MDTKTYLNDYEIKATNNFDEQMVVKASDLRIVTNKRALWQGIIGELKTRRGECQGVGLESYGCDLYKFLGQNIDNLTLREVNHEVLSIAPHYPMVSQMEVTDVVSRKKGTLSLTLIVYSDFGRITGEVTIGS